MVNDPPARQDQNGYNAILDGSLEQRLASARVVLPLLIQTLVPRSVLDVGCGHGAWLQAAKELGVDEIQGVDGPWIDTKALTVPEQFFMSQSLETPLDLGRTYDLVISLEVAEHIPAAAADTFVDSLVRHGNCILFSAAIPFQGGRGHVNEQWPGYWAEKFSRRGFKPIDAIRPVIWSNEKVFWWLRQNTLLFMNDAAMSVHSQFQDEVVEDFDSLAVVHPALYMRWVGQAAHKDQR